MTVGQGSVSSQEPEVAEDEQDDMWFDSGDGILRELIPLYDLKDGSVVYGKTSKYRLYDDEDVAHDG